MGNATHGLTRAVSWALAAIVALAAPAGAQPAATDWRDAWAVDDGFTISVDSEGFALPTAIAMVPSPGPRPEDPLYFVTEMNGRVAVVTNDRTVHTFADDFFSLEPIVKMPWNFQEVGLAGICLEPRRGYVFVTFAYQDEQRVLRNNIVRFQSVPGTFSTSPVSQTAFTEVFAGHESAPSHQIGPCHVENDLLYVSVGDGQRIEASQDPNALQGKILRMTLDGRPAPGNPYYEDDDIGKPANFVWALGFRNPFGSVIVNGRLLVADNGPGVDRFVDVERGRNYLWDGSDWSIGANATQVIAPAVGPVQLAHYDGRSGLFPDEYAGRVFMAISGNSVWATGAGIQRAGVMLLDYDLDSRRMRRPPRYFLRHRGSQAQMVVGVAFGPGGLYVVPLYPDVGDRTAIYRIAHDPGAGHPFVLGRGVTLSDADPLAMMYAKGCLGCHSLGGEGATVGPPLDTDGLVDRVRARLESPEYASSVAAIDALSTEPYASFRQAREEVRRAEGLARVRTWIKYRLLEPRFDDMAPLMPNMALSDEEAGILTDYLVPPSLSVAAEAPSGIAGRIKAALDRRLLPLRYRYLAVAFAAGALVGLMGVAAVSLIRGRRRQAAGEPDQTT